MTVLKTTAIAATLVAGLSGCSASSDGGTGSAGSASLSELNAMADALPATPTSTAALTVNATYTGLANIVGPGSKAYIGDMTLTADFSSVGGIVDGSMTNFASYDPGVADPTTAPTTPVSGDLTISGTTTDTNDVLFPAITGNASGTLDGNSYDMLARGVVLGDTGQYVLMTFTGTGSSGFGVGQ